MRETSLKAIILDDGFLVHSLPLEIGDNHHDETDDCI